MDKSLNKKIGQRFIFGVNNENVEDIINLIKKAYIGGVILYKRNYNSYQDMLSVINKFKEANKENNVPLFIAIDQEGGIVNRLPGEFHPLKNVTDVSKINNDLVRMHANIIGKILYESGINMNFSPVLDIYNGSKSKALYKRCFADDASMVGKLGKEYIKGLNNNQVIAVPKHFPGHGISSLDSHFFVPYAFNYKDVINKHMLPFNEVIPEADAIMVGHIAVRKLTGFLPASMSNTFISNYLRNKFDGLIITDEVNMLKRNPIYRFFYLDMVLKSSSDVILVKIANEEEGWKIINEYKSILLQSEDDRKKLDDIYIRVENIKRKYEINDNKILNGIDTVKINKEIDKINDIVNVGRMK